MDMGGSSSYFKDCLSIRRAFRTLFYMVPFLTRSTCETNFFRVLVLLTDWRRDNKLGSVCQLVIFEALIIHK